MYRGPKDTTVEQQAQQPHHGGPFKDPYAGQEGGQGYRQPEEFAGQGQYQQGGTYAGGQGTGTGVYQHPDLLSSEGAYQQQQQSGAYDSGYAGGQGTGVAGQQQPGQFGGTGAYPQQQGGTYAGGQGVGAAGQQQPGQYSPRGQGQYPQEQQSGAYGDKYGGGQGTYAGDQGTYAEGQGVAGHHKGHFGHGGAVAAGAGGAAAAGTAAGGRHQIHITGGHDAVQRDSAALKQRVKVIHALFDKNPVVMLSMLDPSGKMVSRPMRVVHRLNNIDFMFFTDVEAYKLAQLDRNPEVCISLYDPSTNEWISISGSASLSTDRALIAAQYHDDIKGWLEDRKDGIHDGGPRDPRLALLCVKTHTLKMASRGRPTAAERIKETLFRTRDTNVDEVECTQHELERMRLIHS